MRTKLPILHAMFFCATYYQTSMGEKKKNKNNRVTKSCKHFNPSWKTNKFIEIKASSGSFIWDILITMWVHASPDKCMSTSIIKKKKKTNSHKKGNKTEKAEPPNVSQLGSRWHMFRNFGLFTIEDHKRKSLCLLELCSIN